VNSYTAAQAALSSHVFDQTTMPMDVLAFPDDRYEIFAYAARSWGFALGQLGNTRGIFTEPNVMDVSLYFLTPELIAVGSKAEQHKYHSGQFRSSIQKRWSYWDATLLQMKTRTP
jgi:hypothetical protein